jgi:hypothetical protein
MQDEYEYFRRWCDDVWHYVGFCVTLQDPEGNEIGGESCGGYSSEDRNYIVSEARDAAALMLRRLRRESHVRYNLEAA